MYIVEGNIGTGKSTFLKKLQQSLVLADVVLEAVDYWQKENNGASILQNFYQNPQQWAYSMESLSLKTRVREHVELQSSTTPKIIERSIYSGYHCFAQNSYEQGFLNKLEWNIYNSWFQFATAKKCLPPQGFIYLQADPEVSYQRTIKRDRKAEKSISLEYLQQIHQKHEDFLINKTSTHQSIANTPVLVLNCNHNLIENPDILNDYIAQVRQFITKTQPLHQGSDRVSLQSML